MKDGTTNTAPPPHGDADGDKNDDSVDVIPWERAIEGRMVCQWGIRYDYNKQCVDFTLVKPIPQFLITTLNVDASIYNQCIINCYKSDDAIPYHVDDIVGFGPTVLVYTFGECRPLHFRSMVDDNPSKRTYTAYPKHCSRYLLRADARYFWEHSIPVGKKDRVSITFRSIKGD